MVKRLPAITGKEKLLFPGQRVCRLKKKLHVPLRCGAVPKSLRHTAYIGLGSNIGTRQVNIEKACRYIDTTKKMVIEAASSLFRTSPVGPSQENYYNAVVRMRTSFSPHQLLKELKSIETKMGRRQSAMRWGPRIIDLDILLYDAVCIASKELTIPHGEMHQRLFVLVPLAEVYSGACGKAVDTRHRG